MRIFLNERELFLKKIPFLMMLFGATLDGYRDAVCPQQTRSSPCAFRDGIRGIGAVEEPRIEPRNRRAREVFQRGCKAEQNRAVIDAVSDIFRNVARRTLLLLNDTWERLRLSRRPLDRAAFF